jgi:transposase
MRYAQRGGYTPAEQQRREQLRLEAAGRFVRGDAIKEIAHDLRVTEGSVRRWHRTWRDSGAGALRSKGPVSREKLSPRQWARLETELRKGPLAHGFAWRRSWRTSPPRSVWTGARLVIRLAQGTSARADVTPWPPRASTGQLGKGVYRSAR